AEPDEPAQTADEPESGELAPSTFIEDDLVAPATPPIWIIVLAAALAGLIIFAWYLIPRRRAASVEARQVDVARSAAYAQEIAANREAQAYRQFEKTCQGKDPAQIRLALIAWGRQFYQDPALLTLEDLQEKSGSDALRESIIRIQAAAYGSAATSEAALVEA